LFLFLSDPSLFLSEPSVAFKDRRMTWDYDAKSLQPNQSKGDIVFSVIGATLG
jgi:hypothetical protein